MKRNATAWRFGVVVSAAVLAAGCLGANASGSGEEARGDDGEEAAYGKVASVRADALGGPLSLTRIMEVAKQAGLPCERLVLAAAVAMGESSGYPDATHPNGPTDGCPNGSIDRGLWQINNCYWPEYSESCVFDPACNAKAMAKLSDNGVSWGYWVAYLNGSYAQYLDDAEAAYAQGIPGCPGGGPGTPGGGDPGGSGAGCDSLGYEGKCVGDVSVWSEGGACRVRDCGAEGRACGWISDSIGWGCMGGTSGATTVDCASLGYTGACMSDTLVWVDGGECRTVHCASSGRSCGWAGDIGYNCL